jgi:hypothetical protein
MFMNKKLKKLCKKNNISEEKLEFLKEYIESLEIQIKILKNEVTN